MPLLRFQRVVSGKYFVFLSFGINVTMTTRACSSPAKALSKPPIPFSYHYYPLEHCSDFPSPITLHTGTVNTANSPSGPLAGFEQLGGSINSYDGLRSLGYICQVSSHIQALC